MNQGQQILPYSPPVHPGILYRKIDESYDDDDKEEEQNDLGRELRS
jgi:hypothetical protein